MQFCQRHWDLLREEVHALGMGEFISADGDVAAARIEAEMKGDDTVENFDPLMRCHMMILNRSLEIAGMAVLDPEFGCPICRFNERRTEDGRCPCTSPTCGGKEPGSIRPFESWIIGTDSCTEHVRAYMVKRGWISA